MKNLLWIGLLALCALVLVPSAGQASCSSIVYCSVAAIYCNGQSTCLSGSNWVQCDNQARIYCPNCGESVQCCNGSERFCTGYTSCQAYSDHVTCDGVSHYCPDCPNYGAAGDLPGFLQSLGAATAASACSL